MYAEAAQHPTPTQMHLYRVTADHWLAVTGDIAVRVRPDQLNTDWGPPARLILDRTLAWEPVPAWLAHPVAVYTVERRPHVLVLTRQGSAPPSPVTEPELDWGSQNRTGKWKAISLYGTRSTHRGAGE